MLEKQPHVGGGAVTTEIHAGFRCPRFSHEVLLDERIVDDLNLERHGVEFIPLPALVCAPSPDGAPLVLHDDAAASADGLRSFNSKDADAYVEFRTLSNDWPP